MTDVWEVLRARFPPAPPKPPRPPSRHTPRQKRPLSAAAAAELLDVLTAAHDQADRLGYPPAPQSPTTESRTA